MNIRDAYAIFAKHDDLKEIAWTHHGLGMLQGKVDHTTRIHLWHPLLVTDEMSGPRAIHDHRFELTSHVLYGELVDVPHRVTLNELESGVPSASVWAIPHKEVQTEDDKHGGRAVFLGRATIVPGRRKRYAQGEVYTIPARAWHTTALVGPAITLVTRDKFDAEPARVLAHGRSGQVDIASPALLERVFTDCRRLIARAGH